MKLSEKQELLIQRCVDGELSPAETRSLLLGLDAIEGGWKSLACGLLEDRQLRMYSKTPELFRNASVASSDPKAGVPPVSPSRGADRVVRQWWSHPVTSLSLCAAIAFVGGLLIPDFGSRSTPSLVSNGGVRSPQYSARNVAQEPYRLEFSSDNENSFVPVYPTVGALQKNQPDHPLFRSRRGEEDRYEWIVVPVEENRSMLMPVTEQVDSVPMQ